MQDPREVRVVVLGGAGKAFCAGADIEWMARTVRYTKEQNLEDAAAAARMFSALDSLRVPLVGRVQGAALGGGAGLAAVCDVVVAEDRAVFGFTEVKLGILPAVISPFALAKIGRAAARELFLTGRPLLGPARAGDWPRPCGRAGTRARRRRRDIRRRIPHGGSRGHRRSKGADSRCVRAVRRGRRDRSPRMPSPHAGCRPKARKG